MFSLPQQSNTVSNSFSGHRLTAKVLAGNSNPSSHTSHTSNTIENVIVTLLHPLPVYPVTWTGISRSSCSIFSWTLTAIWISIEIWTWMNWRNWKTKMMKISSCSLLRHHRRVHIWTNPRHPAKKMKVHETSVFSVLAAGQAFLSCYHLHHLRQIPVCTLKHLRHRHPLPLQNSHLSSPVHLELSSDLGISSFSFRTT